MFLTAQQFGLFSLRRLVGCAALLSVCLAVLPLPVAPPPKTEKDSSSPFPCQNRPCGCRTADQCWRKCCCFTNAEKVAWAKANDVKIPEFVLVAATEESNAAKAAKTQVTAQLARPAKCGCQAIAVARSGSTVGDAICCAERPKPPAAAPPVKRGVSYVIGLFAEECHGEHGSISALPLAIPPIDVAVVRNDALLSWSLPPTSEAGAGLSRPPAIPPPRLTAGLFI